MTVTTPCFYSPLIPDTVEPSGESICVYPEAHRGNRLNAKRIVRYCLYYQSKHGGGDRIPKEDLPVVYHPDYFDDVAAHCDLAITRDAIIMLPVIEASWLFPEKKTIENSFYAGKGEGKKPEVELNIIEGSHDRTIAVLRRTRNFYTLDKSTAMSNEAVLCGCEVLIPSPDGGWIKNELAHSESHSLVMNPIRDMEIAARFAVMAGKFFEGKE